MGKDLEFKIIITADAINCTPNNEEQAILKAETKEAIKKVLTKHNIKLLDVFIDN